MRDTAEGPRIDPGEVMVQRVAAIVLEGLDRRLEELDRRFTERLQSGFAAMEERTRFLFRYNTPIHFDRETVIHTNDYHRVILDTRERGIVCHLIENGEWESHVRKIYRQVLTHGSTVADVGANIGLHALFAAALIGPEGRVHAFEPDPISLALLRRNLELNGLHYRAHVHAGACTERGGESVAFGRLVEESMMSGLLVPEWKNLAIPPEQITVQTIALDDVISSPVDLLKIDVEGAEGRVIAGASKAVGRDTVSVLELIPKLIDDVSGPTAFVETLQFFRERGFKMLRLESDLRQVVVQGDWEAEARGRAGDFAFVHPEGCHAGAFGI